MTSTTEKKHLFDDPKNVDLLLRVFYALCILLVVVDFFVHRHIMTAWEELPAFYAIYGFVACVVLVVLAKIMRKYVMRKEEYYGD